MIIAAACFVALSRPADSHLELSVSRVVNVQDVGTLKGVDFRLAALYVEKDSKVVFIRVSNPDARPLCFGNAKVQMKVAGFWLEEEENAWLNSKYFSACVEGGSQQEFTVAVVPHNTEAIRLSLKYQHPSLIEEARNIHNWSGLYQRFPKLVDWVFPKLDRRVFVPLLMARNWQRVKTEFMLPSPPLEPVKVLDQRPLER